MEGQDRPIGFLDSPDPVGERRVYQPPVLLLGGQLDELTRYDVSLVVGG